MAWKDGFVIEYVPRKKKRKRKRKSKAKSASQFSNAAREEKKERRALAVGNWVESPKHGKGKVAAIDGQWISVEFTKISMRKKYDMTASFANGNLRRL